MTEETPPRVRAILPRGLVDRGPADIAAAEAMMAKIRGIYELYGFEAVETPFLEYTDALGKFLPDQDRPNEGVFSLRDDDEQWLSLRYDLTAPLARYVAENYEKLPKPYRSYRAGWVFRNEKPGPGRFRQFMQFDADTVGAGSVAADAEMCMMAADCMEALGLKGRYVIKVNSRNALDGHLEATGIIDPATKLKVLRAFDKLDRLGLDGMIALLGKSRTDQSGAVTEGAGLTPAQIEANVAFITTKTAIVPAKASKFSYDSETQSVPPGAKTIEAELRESLKMTDTPELLAVGLGEVDEIISLVRAVGYDEDRIRFDPSVVRGLEYYTGPVFEAELTFETPDEHGKPIRFGSVGGGGRYDGLVARFRGEPVPATGFSIGISRLLAALRAINSPLVAAAKKPGPVVVAVLDRDHMANYQKLVARLRAAGIASELYLGAAGLNAQLKYADKRGALCAVIQGSNERDAGQVAIRDLVLGAELAKASKDRADYLELRQKAQALAPEGELVARVKEVLERHGG
jgi:histidyl-tRNA synthetase